MYKLVKPIVGNMYIQRLSDNAFIPMAEDNTDYQAYLKWVEAGGVPEAADEPA
jgi:hypothetical protein